MSNHMLRTTTLVLLTLLLAACGGDAPAEGPSSSEAAPVAAEDSGPAAPPAEPARAAAGQPYTATAADVAAYEQGLRREVEVPRAAEERLRQAEDDEQRLEILGEIQPRALRREGAAAAGTSDARYAQLTAAINDVLAKREMAAASQQMMPSGAELDSMPPERRAQVEENLRQMQAAWGDPYAGLAAPAVEALEQRADELARLRAEHIGLLVEPR